MSSRSPDPACGKRGFLASIAASAELIAAPERNRKPLEARLPLEHYEAYRDEQGNLFLASFEGLKKGMVNPARSLFFGAEGALGAQSVYTWHGDDGEWSITFLDSQLGTGETASLRYAEQRPTLVCAGDQQHPLTVVLGDERARLLERATFSEPRWRPFALGRGTEKEYVYIDVATEPVRYRIFVGNKGALRLTGSFPIDEMLWEEDAAWFVWHEGRLHCRSQTIAGDESYVMSWEGRSDAVYFVPMSPWQNHRLVFEEFGLYRHEPTPCSVHAAAARGVTPAQAR